MGKVAPEREVTLPPGELAAEPGERSRWSRALLIVVSLHALPVLVAAWWLAPPILSPPAEPAILVDMAPPAAPPVPPSEQPPGPEQVKAERPVPEDVREVVKTPVVPNAAVAIPVRPPEPPREIAREVAPETTAPASRPLPPAPVASNATPTWQGLVLGRLNQFKRYPREAQARRQQGVPYIRFVMDREGRVLSSTLERSSGYATLDRDAVALPRRAQPLPKPPPEVTGATVELVVPVEFFLR
jgi:protein TonB